MTGLRGPDYISIETYRDAIVRYLESKGLGSGGSVQRLAIVLGALTNDQKIKANIPSGERSRYSMQRYQFLLDAPFEISNKCCYVIKKTPARDLERSTGMKPMTGQLASESKLRTQKWIMYGCNAFDARHPISNPLSFWVDDDILLYIYQNHIPIAPVYGKVVKENEIDGQLDFEDLGLFDIGRPCLQCSGMERSGCYSCLFGIHMEKPSGIRFKRTIEFSDPRIVDIQLKGGRFNDKGLWEPYRGFGYWFLLEYVNRHGNFNIWYPNREHYLETYMTDETRRYLE